MAFIAKDSGGGDFKKVPPGAYIGRCYSLIDLGTQLTSGQYGEKMQHKIRIGWELFGDDEEGNPLTVEVDGKQMPMTISKSYTVSLHEKAGLRKDLAAWRGRDFTDEEAKAFDITKLLGKPCMINIIHKPGKSDPTKTYQEISSITGIPKGMTIPEQINKTVVLSYDNFHIKR